jgi:hypothetical protein
MHEEEGGQVNDLADVVHRREEKGKEGEGGDVRRMASLACGSQRPHVGAPRSSSAYVTAERYQSRRTAERVAASRGVESALLKEILVVRRGGSSN